MDTCRNVFSFQLPPPTYSNTHLPILLIRFLSLHNTLTRRLMKVLVFVPVTTSTIDSKSFYVHLNLDARLPTIADGTTRRSPTVMCRTIAIAPSTIVVGSPRTREISKLVALSRHRVFDMRGNDISLDTYV